TAISSIQISCGSAMLYIHQPNHSELKVGMVKLVCLLGPLVSVGRSMSSHQTWNVFVGPSNWNSAQIQVCVGTSFDLSLSVQSPELPLSVPTPNALNCPPKRMTADVPVPAPSASEKCPSVVSASSNQTNMRP